MKIYILKPYKEIYNELSYIISKYNKYRYSYFINNGLLKEITLKDDTKYIDINTLQQYRSRKEVKDDIGNYTFNKMFHNKDIVYINRSSEKKDRLVKDRIDKDNIITNKFVANNELLYHSKYNK